MAAGPTGSGPDSGPDPVDGRLRHQTRLADGIEAELFGDQLRVDEVLATQRERGQPGRYFG
ncbi:hypothetical protein ACIQPR_47590 [Streptomyces sp. NPDC091280]|uniref:hypothetical protein n=1 Tax=Streptomyces sp. NPDC091280 TaxID=3365984 RepID=UPI00380D45CD